MLSTAESEQLEKKGQFDGSDQQWIGVVKTIVAFANTSGGQIILAGVVCDRKTLDSARIDDKVNKYVEPRVSGICSDWISDGQCAILVPRSPDRPHVFKQDASYQHEGRTRAEAHQGQVLVRHGSKTESATASDYRRMIQEGAGTWLRQLAMGIDGLSAKLTNSADAMPARLTDDTGLLTIHVDDSSAQYPHIASDIARRIGRKTNWVARAVDVLGIRNDPLCCRAVPYGKSVLYKYSETAIQRLRDKLAAEPEFSPYQASNKDSVRPGNGSVERH